MTDIEENEKTPACPGVSGRLLGVDLGDARTGLAVSDERGILASGIGTVSGGAKKVLEAVAQAAEEYSVKAVVLGDPVNMNGTRGPRSEKAQRFAERLRERLGIPVILFDERLTTVAAIGFMNATDTRGQKRKDTVDTLAAQIILQDYLDSQAKK